jgi:hypothetical protein
MTLKLILLFGSSMFLCGLALGLGIKMDKEHNDDSEECDDHR